MQGVSIERFRSDIPTFFHCLLQVFPCFLLLGSQHALLCHRHQASNGFAVTRDDEFLAGLHLADAAGEALVGVPE